MGIEIHRFNDLLKLLRVTAFVCRFIKNLKAKMVKPLTLNRYAVSSEIKEAKFRWIKDNQIDLNEDGFEALKVNLVD